MLSACFPQIIQENLFLLNEEIGFGIFCKSEAGNLREFTNK